MIPAEIPQRPGAAFPRAQGDAFNIWLVDADGHIAVSPLGLALVAGINRLVVPPFGSTEHAMEWGSHLDAADHAVLVDLQRSASDAALDEGNPQRMVNLATRSQLLREAAKAFVPATMSETNPPVVGPLPSPPKGSA